MLMPMHSMYGCVLWPIYGESVLELLYRMCLKMSQSKVQYSHSWLAYRPSALIILQQSVLPVKFLQGAVIQHNFIKIILIAFYFNLCNVYLDNKFVK